MLRLLVPCIVVLLLPRVAGAVETGGAARGTCAPPVEAWVTACADAEHLDLGALECFPDRVIVEAKGDAALRFDIARDGSRSFRRVGQAGLSPLGQFPDWGAEPEPRRRALDALAACLARNATFLESPALAAPEKPPAAAPPPEVPHSEVQPSGFAGRTVAAWPSLLVTALAAAALGLVGGSLWQRRRGSARTVPKNDDAKDQRFQASPISVILLLCSVAVVEAWAIHAADPDFFFPDPFHYLVAGAALLFILAGFVRWPQVRRGLVTLAIAAPLVILAMEWRLSAVDVNNRHIAPSSDGLLRYTYRPGFPIEESEGERIVVTEDGLWDVPHVIPKPPGVLRVVVLGDSVPNDPSIPFRRRFPRQLEALLAEKAPAGQKVEVLNVSCEGFNTLQEVRLLESVGLRYEPDLVVLAYVLNDPFLQNGGYRRIGNSFFAFHFANITVRRKCPLFEEMHAGYTFDLVVRSSLSRLRLLADKHHFQVLVAPLPLVEPFDDPSCLSVYDKVIAAAREQGFSAGRVVDAFQGEDHRAFLKPQDALDITHPNAQGHDRMARRLAELAAPLVLGRATP
ncbi:SGNH/GDSL hydrolase family protein [Polyangium sp. y55x31]|uniref:SGNH/GDSL hydrolase family protein n=1 Tax=Polyangium sp. y55x31 TaxID=3042688 RepID=UPI0024825FFA|nr:SGNH/GDSL hydrolase family protein [Polyangium sp. y55x31]MDI1476268.1 SGNH/GDSL hydrolase family protein [Polyangium sp. y55x31]